MPERGHIRIETSIDDKHLQLSITDNGSGIPKAIQFDIFETFLTDRPDGTGFGLSTSKRILRDHRGNIEPTQSSPEGSTFRFWLLRAQ